MKALAAPLSVAAALVLIACMPRLAAAFGDHGAFEPRVLLTGSEKSAAHPTASGRWSYELVQRTSAPARLRPGEVRATDKELLHDPFVVWSHDHAVAPLTGPEVAQLRRFFALGGLLFVDDAGVSPSGEPSAFGKQAREQLARVLPESAPLPLPDSHVLYRTYYLLRRPEGRVLGPKAQDAIVRNGKVQVLFGSQDLSGALSRGASGLWELPVTPGGEAQRERAVRFAVNLAMYVLCSNYKDDQVHAPFLMRERHGRRP